MRMKEVVEVDLGVVGRYSRRKGWSNREHTRIRYMGERAMKKSGSHGY